MSEEICKYNQYAFCKFRTNCRKRREKELCSQSTDCKSEKCLKIHPKVCRNYAKHKGCRHAEKCAYTHIAEVTITKQNEMNDLVAQIMSK